MYRFILPAAMAAVALSLRDHLRACFSSPPAATAAAGDSTTLRPLSVAQQLAIPGPPNTGTEQRPQPVHVRPDPSSPARSTPFWRLPAELRDIIYELAYTPPASRNVKIVHLAKWMETERIRRDATKNNRAVKPPALPVCPLTQVLVSRQFYREASAAWFRTRIVRWDYWDREMMSLWNASKDLQRCVVAVEIQWKDYESENRANVEGLRYFRNLRSVEIGIEVSGSVTVSFQKPLIPLFPSELEKLPVLTSCIGTNTG